MAVIIGLIMAAVFRKSEKKCDMVPAAAGGISGGINPEPEEKARPGYITALFMAILVAILLVATSSLFELLPKAIIVAAWHFWPPS